MVLRFTIQSYFSELVTNYLKTVEDALNGVAYADDKQILRVRGSKK